MAKFNGMVVLQLQDVEVVNKKALEDVLCCLIPEIATQISDFQGTPKTTSVTGGINGIGTSGVSGSATVTTSGNNGSMSATVQGGTGTGITGGSLTGTWTF